MNNALEIGQCPGPLGLCLLVYVVCLTPTKVYVRLPAHAGCLEVINKLYRVGRVPSCLYPMNQLHQCS